MGCGLSNTIWNNYKNLPPYTPDKIVKHGPNLIGKTVHIIGYVGLRQDKALKKHVIYSPFDRNEYGVYIKINISKYSGNRTNSKKLFTGRTGVYFTVHNNNQTDTGIVISMENPEDWLTNFNVTYKHYNIECADHAMSMLRAGGKFDGNRGGITDRPDLKVFWQTFQKGKDPLNRLQTSQDISFGGQPRRATEHILRINEKVSVVGILEKDIDTNQYILLPNKKSEEKGKIQKNSKLTDPSNFLPMDNKNKKKIFKDPDLNKINNNIGDSCYKK